MKAGHLLEPLLIRQVPNPKPVKHKIPVRLQAKIREIPKPVIGLQCIEEFMPHYDPEAEPYYECFLCGSRGEANCMFSHVTSGSHQRKVLQAKYPNDLKFIDPPR